MAVQLNARARMRRDFEDADVIDMRRARQAPPPPEPAAAPATDSHAAQPSPTPTPPQAPPPPPFWAAGTPVPPNALNDLPEPPVQAAAQAQADVQAAEVEVPSGRMQIPFRRRITRGGDGDDDGYGGGTARRAPVATTALTPVAAAAAAVAAQPVVPPPYVGERPVDAAWLAEREAALKSIRADYEAQRAQAQAQPPAFSAQAPGWIEATLVTDESGQTRSASGADVVFVSDPGAEPVVISYDESGRAFGGATPGRALEFNEEAFAAHYRAQSGAPLQTLARLYATDAATLLARHPQLWQLATQDHALNAGPPPPGRAMGDAVQLGTLDLYLADPQIAELVTTYGGSVPPAASAIAHEQVRIHGQARYEQLTRLGQAMQAVRDTYTAALAQAANSGNGVGWNEQQRMGVVSDESGSNQSAPVFAYDEGGSRTPLMERTFDPDAFTRWYTAQPSLANRAFADFYGNSHTQYSSDESGASRPAALTFDNANWVMHGIGGAMAHRELISLDPNHTPRLRNDSAVGFDLEAGWATHHSNIHKKRDWFETVLQVAVIGVVSWVSAGTLGAAAASAVGGGVAGAVASAAVVGAAASAASGLMSGNLTFKGVMQGALSGALTAGLMGSLGGAVQNVAGTAGTIALRATVQGGIQALLGGQFRDGALAGLASGLADAAGANLTKGINDALANGSMTAAEAVAARMSARVLGSAIRALGNPNDPQYAFASAFVGSVVNDGLNAASSAGAPVVGTRPGVVTRVAFDDEGNLMPGVVDTKAPTAQQVAQLRDVLVGQGLAANEATSLAWARLAPLPDPFGGMRDVDDRTAAERLADQLGVPRNQIVDAGLVDNLGRSAQVLAGFVEGAGISILVTADGLVEIAKSPMQFVHGVRALLTSAEARGQFAQELIDRVKVDVQMLEDAFNAGDMRGTGQQLGKLTTDLAQVAGGVDALARLGVSAGTAGGRVLVSATQAFTARVAEIRGALPGVQLTDDVATRIANNFGRDGDMFTAAAEEMAAARRAGWREPDGSPLFPKMNAGAVPGSQVQVTLQPGMRLDRFGGTSPRSTFLAPVDVGIDQRSLAPTTNLAIRDEYVVLRPFTVEQSNVMPWFGKSGLGTQINTAAGANLLTIDELVALKYLQKVKP